MDWQAVGVISAGALSLASLAVAIVSVRVSVRGQRKADARAQEADAQAQRSADASERAAQAAERMATALERQALEDERHAPTPGVVWRLEHFQGDAYLLTNAGRASAYDVAVETGDMLVGDQPRADVLRPNDSLKFGAVRTLATRDDTVTVWWSEEEDRHNRRSWRRPLPPRPRR